MDTISKKDWLVLRIALYACVVGAILYVYENEPVLLSAWNNSEHPSLSLAGAASSTIPATDAENPVRLIIPSIGVNANVQWVGVGIHGNLAVPINYTDVAWYRSGPLPGAQGNAVIDGHVDNGWGLRAVFLNLNQLKPGDLIYVVNGMGSSTTFKVMDSEVYDYQSAPTAKIFGATSTHALNLITCAGSYIQDLRTNNKRLVVYTEEVQ